MQHVLHFYGLCIVYVSTEFLLRKYVSLSEQRISRSIQKLKTSSKILLTNFMNTKNWQQKLKSITRADEILPYLNTIIVAIVAKCTWNRMIKQKRKSFNQKRMSNLNCSLENFFLKETHFWECLWVFFVYWDFGGKTGDKCVREFRVTRFAF